MKQFNEMTVTDLTKLRKEVVLNSMFRHDYQNSFGFKPSDIHDFFDGFYDFIWEVATEENENNIELTHAYICEHYDNADMLERWFNMFEDLSWIHAIED